MKDQGALTIKAALLQHWIYRHGKFQTALSDQARNVDGNTVWTAQRREERFIPLSAGRRWYGWKSYRNSQDNNPLCITRRKCHQIQMAWWSTTSSFPIQCFEMQQHRTYSLWSNVWEKPALPLTIMQSSTESTTTIKGREYEEELKAELEHTWERVSERIVAEKEKRAKFYNAGKRAKNADEGDFIYAKNQRRCS